MFHFAVLHTPPRYFVPIGKNFRVFHREHLRRPLKIKALPGACLILSRGMSFGCQCVD